MRGNAWVWLGVASSFWFQPSNGRAAVQDERAEIAQELLTLKQEFEAMKASYEGRLDALESRLVALEGTAPAAAEVPEATAEVPPGAAGAGGPSGTLPTYGGASAGSKIFNPDIAVIGDFLGAAGENPVDPTPAFEMHESEASFQAIVDPYARADFFLAFGQEGVELEEGYISFPTLPGGLLGRVGKMRGAFGKVNTLHNHSLTWTDRPLVTDNLVGGEEGISDAGFSLARLIPNPWIFLEATGQVYRGDSEVFHSYEPSDLTYLAHLRGYHDFTESSNLDLGASYSRGHNDAGEDFVTDLYGVDATFRYRPLRRSIYRSLSVRTELIWSQRGQRDGRQDAFGYYLSGDYQFARRWFAGLRYDWSNRANDATATDKGGSLLLTFWPSEFSQIRGQYRRTRYAEGEIANELVFQLMFSIGAHGAHPF